MTTEHNTAQKKKTLYLLIIVLVLASIALRVLNDYRWEQSSILFIGLPAFITFLMIKYSGKPESAYGIVFKTITLFLLMSSILLGEGTICVLFAAPIFYGVGALIVFIVQYFKGKNDYLNTFIILPILIILAEPIGSFKEPKIQKVETIAIVNHTTTLEAFNTQPDFLKDFPTWLNMGFPKPVGINGLGIEEGSIRDIQFESSTKGIGTLSLEVIKREDESITFKAINDDTHINHWLTWDNIKVEHEEIDSLHTKITWTTTYKCDLSPKWYFEPLERYTVGIMNTHLINAYFDE